MDAETGRQKPAPKCASSHRDQNPGIEWPEIPAATPYLASYRKRPVCGDWVVELVGLKLGTRHPVIEPVSAMRRERKFPPQRQAGKSRLITEQKQIQRRAGSEKAPIPVPELRDCLRRFEP